MGCDAWHHRDRTRCEGPADAVTVTDRSGSTVAGCVRHGAALVATVVDAQVVDGPGAAGYRDPMTGESSNAATVAAGYARHMGPWALVDRLRVRGEDARVAAISDYRR
jgi:hypothetical protein